MLVQILIVGLMLFLFSTVIKMTIEDWDILSVPCIIFIGCMLGSYILCKFGIIETIIHSLS